MRLGSRAKAQSPEASGAVPQPQDDGYFRQSSASSSETCIRNIHETRTPLTPTVAAHAASSNNSFSRIVCRSRVQDGAGGFTPPTYGELDEEGRGNHQAFQAG